MGSVSQNRGLGTEPPSGGLGSRAPGEGQGQSPLPEAESSVAFEALVEEPNLTLVTDSFLQLIQRNISV